jgi:protein-tyrosine-phosphatase
MTATSAISAGTHPAARVHPGAVAAGRRAGVDLTGATPRSLEDLTERPALTITVCDRAHEALDPGPEWLHWSIPDPLPDGSRTAFDATVTELRRRITHLVAAA